MWKIHSPGYFFHLTLISVQKDCVSGKSTASPLTLCFPNWDDMTRRHIKSCIKISFFVIKEFAEQVREPLPLFKLYVRRVSSRGLHIILFSSCYCHIPLSAEITTTPCGLCKIFPCHLLPHTLFFTANNSMLIISVSSYGQHFCNNNV